MTDSVLTLLQRHTFVEDFEPRHVEVLASIARRVGFEKGQVIFREGDECPDFYLVVSGMVAVEIAAADETYRVQTITPGHEFGWSAVLMSKGKYFQARSLDKVDAFAIDGAQLLVTCKCDPEFGFVFMRRLVGVVAERLQATRMQLVDMHSPVAKWAGA